MSEILEIIPYGLYEGDKLLCKNNSLSNLWRYITTYGDKFVELDCSVDNELKVYLRKNYTIRIISN